MSENACASCGYHNPLGANFCTSCGHQLMDRSDSSTEMLDPTLSTPLAAPTAESVAVAGLGMFIVRQGSKRGSRMALDAPTVSIGRHPDSDIFLDDITVSRRHATVSITPNGHQVADAGSLNGTYVNKERVDDALLHDGDEVQVGKFKLVYVALGSDLEAADSDEAPDEEASSDTDA